MTRHLSMHSDLSTVIFCMRRTHSGARWWAATDIADDPRQAKLMLVEAIQDICINAQESLMLNETIEMSYEQATNGSNAKQWTIAVKEHLGSHEENGTWDLVPMGNRSKKELVTNKYVFVKKKDKQGNVKRWKARMVARGFSQIKGLNYKETFSPTVKPTTVRWLLSLKAARRMKGVFFDVSDAYLKAYLDEDIYLHGSSQGTTKLAKVKRNNVLQAHKRTVRT